MKSNSIFSDTDENDDECESSGEEEPADGSTIRTEERSVDSTLRDSDRDFLDSESETSQARDAVKLARTLGEFYGQKPTRKRIRSSFSSISTVSSSTGGTSSVVSARSGSVRTKSTSRQRSTGSSHRNGGNASGTTPTGRNQQRIPNKRSRGWTIVVNNYNGDDRTRLESMWTTGLRSDKRGMPPFKCKFLIYQLEVAPTTGTHHIQGYVQFASQISLRTLVNHMVRPDGTRQASFKSANGSASQNKAYCTKAESRMPGPDSGPFEFGTCPNDPGKRSDLRRAIELVQKGTSVRGICDEVPVAFVMYPSGLNKMRTYYDQTRGAKTHVEWYYGPPGTGKSMAAHDRLPHLPEPVDGAPLQYRLNSTYSKNTADQWWDGYDGHRVVILDDLRPNSSFDLATLLKLFDRYPHRIQNKGGTLEFFTEVIIVTCPFHPVEFWQKASVIHNYQDEDPMQFYRRIDSIKKFEYEPEATPADITRAQEWVTEFTIQQNRFNL